jgi:hypothetical protein
VVYKTVDMCYNHDRVACVSRTAARCIETYIAPSEPQEESHEDH